MGALLAFSSAVCIWAWEKHIILFFQLLPLAGCFIQLAEEIQTEYTFLPAIMLQSFVELYVYTHRRNLSTFCRPNITLPFVSPVERTQALESQVLVVLQPFVWNQVDSPGIRSCKFWIL